MPIRNTTQIETPALVPNVAGVGPHLKLMNMADSSIKHPITYAETEVN